MNMFSFAGRAFLPLLICLLTCSASRTSDAEELRFKFKKGERFKIKVQQESSTVQSSGESSVKLTMEFSLEITDVSQDSFQVSQSIGRLQMSLVIPGLGTLRFDTSGDTPGGLSKGMLDAVKPLIDAKIIQDVNSRGQISNIKIPAQAFKSVQANMYLATMFSDDFVKQMCAQCVVPLPEKDVQKDDEWNSSIRAKTPLGLMKTNNIYRYGGKDGQGLNRLLINTRIAFEVDPQSPFDVKVTVKEQDTGGVILFDNNAGHLFSSEVNQKMVLLILANGAEIKQTVSS